jgi:preprotein translocase subunit SecF
MDFLRDTKIDFMGRRRLWMTVSLILNVIAILVVFVQGRLNLGVDFAGGTQLTVRFAQTPDVNQLRELVREAGVAEASIQRLGTGQENEVILRTPLVEGQSEGSRARIEAALDQALNGGRERLDLNRVGNEALADWLLERDPDRLRASDEALAAEHYRELAERVGALRREQGLLTSWVALDVEGVSARHGRRSRAGPPSARSPSSAPRTSVRRSAPSCGARPVSRWRCRCWPCWPTSGSASSSTSASALWWRRSTTC